MPHFLACIFLLILCTRSFGFGQIGHEVIANIAQEHLSLKAKKSLVLLFGSDFDLSKISNWADEIKSVQPESKSSHYINLEINTGKTFSQQLAKCETPNIYTASINALQMLKNKNASSEEKAEAIKWLIHLLGDMHQPLHIGENHDHGGNEFLIKWKRHKYNLHEVWDYVLIEQGHRTSAALALLLNHEITQDKAFAKQMEQGDIKEWMQESFAKARACYQFKGNFLKRNQELPLGYVLDNEKVVRTQLKIAGMRLASLLNGIL